MVHSPPPHAPRGRPLERRRQVHQPVVDGVLLRGVQLRPEHLRRRGGGQQLPIVGEQGPEDLEVRIPADEPAVPAVAERGLGAGEDLERRELGEESVDRVVQGEVALLDQLHERDADEELGGRGGPEVEVCCEGGRVGTRARGAEDAVV
ncbi:hypothetical protein VP1G_11322 [Cytospora mali]|uniref:Uncharacterized protein n=1 Tax=Cytospora mali TaxID=578113 RepID=A0A194VE94_CYTMA|nr:hypothetical protein VP1G_11322 [Valsa mali var. pyri (nom. inval.)]